MKIRTFLAVVIIALIGGAAYSGTFKDRDGVLHEWAVDVTHALVWEGTPYVPFGVVFEPKYLTDGQTDDGWTADAQQVAALKTAGVKDIILRSGNGITSVPVEAFQKVIDLLETNGLSYGVELYDPPYVPLSGYVVQPKVNRVEGIRKSGEITRNFPNTKTAIYVLCDAKTGEVKDSGQVIATNGDVTVLVSVPNDSNNVLLLYPQKVISGGMPDVWADYDRNRDRLVRYFSQVKFGKNLRFFADPFTCDIEAGDEVEDLIPSSNAFRLQYAAWLSKKYDSPGNLNIAWSVAQHDVTSFNEAARLVPLWRSGRGTAAVYDKVTDSRYSVDAARSVMWMDFMEFRAYSLREYMDSMADVLKRFAGDVPVVYTASGLQSMFQTSGSVGYDGLTVLASDGKSQVTNAGQVFSLAEHSSRKMWILSRLEPYQKKEDLFGALNALHDLGTKGFFVNVFQGAGGNSSDLVTWLAEYASVSAGDMRFAGYLPQAVYYPKGYAQGSIKRLSGDIWWLPVIAGGGGLYLGDTLDGYVLLDPKSGGADVYVWSTNGKKVITMVASDTVTLTTLSGESTEIKPKKGRVQFTVGSDPMLIHGVDVDKFMPIEVVVEAIQKLEGAIAQAKDRKLDVAVYNHNLDRARDMLKKNQLTVSLDIAQASTEEINLLLERLENEPALRSDGTSIEEKLL